MYYTISVESDDNGMIQGFSFDNYDESSIEFDEGHRLQPHSHPTALDIEKEPAGVLKLLFDEAEGKAPLPSFLSMPKPLMSKQLLDVLRAAGVNNIDAYKAELYYPDGSLAPGEYYIVNVIGLIAAADLKNSVYDPNQPDKMIAMSFDSLAIDSSKTYGALMFRLAESISEIIVHEQVKQAVEEAGVPLVRFFKTEEIAIL